MKVEQTSWTKEHGWAPSNPGLLAGNPQLVFVFGSTACMKEEEPFDLIKEAYPQAHLLGCSTAGEIQGTRIHDDSLVVTAVSFDHTRIEGKSMQVLDGGKSHDVGKQLAQSLDHKGLVHVFVLSDGLCVNGSDLVRGLSSCLPSDVTVTGGLSADGADFNETYVLWDDQPKKDMVAVLGFYSNRLKVGCGSLGGWDPFGPERLITRAAGNILYELDGKSALDLYKKYLGEHAEGLPATGLLYPLMIRTTDKDERVVRTILATNEEDQSLTFAGDMPEGAYAQLMKANFDRLIDGAVGAAKLCARGIKESTPDLAILISCVGRKLVLKQRVEEEVEGVRDVLGGQAVLAGFYSYGEISPFSTTSNCALHNQTMTITTFTET